MPQGFSAARRSMLAAGLLVPLAARAEPVTRTLFLLRVQTGEDLRLAYLQGDRWLPGAYERICWILRDVQANEVAPIDYRLVAILAWAQWLLQRYGYTGPIHVLSGYRSIETNLRTEGRRKIRCTCAGRPSTFVPRPSPPP